MTRIVVGSAAVDPVAEELKRLTNLKYLENVKRICGKTWPEVCAEFESEMDALKRAENPTLTRNSYRGGR